MEDMKLIRLLKTFNTSEMRRFQEFVSSPYFNKNQNLILLLAFLKKHHPNYQHSKFNVKNAYKFVFPKTDFKEGAISKLLSKLFKLVVEFFTIEGSLDSSFRQEYSLLRQYDIKHLSHDFKRLSNNIEKNLTKNTLISSQDNYNNLIYQKEINRISTTRNDTGIGDAFHREVNRALDLYYFYDKLLYSCSEINRAKNLKGVNIEGYNNEIINLLPQTPYLENPVIDLWYQTYQILTQAPTLIQYKKLKSSLFEHHHLMINVDAKVLFTILENTAFSLFPGGNELYEEVFELYNFQIKSGIFLQEQVTVFGTLRNYIVVANYLGKLELAVNYIKQVREKLMLTHPDSLLLCEAIIEFHKNNYETALDKLNAIQTDNIIIKIEERSWRIKVYYHLDYKDPLYDSLNSFRVFLTNNKKSIQEDFAERYKKFMTCLLQILKAPSLDTATRQQIKSNYLDETTVIAEKRWLLGILDEN